MLSKHPYPVLDALLQESGDPDIVLSLSLVVCGGFLGVGSRKIAVDWNALSFAPPSSGRDVVTLELTRDQVKAAIERIIRAEAVASGAEKEPLFDWRMTAPVLVSDPEKTAVTVAAFGEHFGAAVAARERKPSPAFFAKANALTGVGLAAGALHQLSPFRSSGRASN